MRPPRKRAGLWAGLALALPAAAAADEKAKAPEADAQPDAELLEFLGSIDDLDAAWSEYLAETDIRTVVKANRGSAPKDETDD